MIWLETMEDYINMCAVFGCYEVYEGHKHTDCPRCGISSADIVSFGTNERQIINKKKFDRDIAELYNDALGG